MAATKDEAPAKDAKKQVKKLEQDPDADLSEEDLELKKNIELMVERVQDPDSGVQQLALESICKEIHSTSSSMTAVPKPLKFLRSHLDVMLARFEQLQGENRKQLADIISVLCSTVAGKEGEREGLKYKLQGHTDDLGTWGHEYMRHIAGEISEEYRVRHEADLPVDDLMHLVKQIVPYHMSHNAEPEAVDLLLEVEQLPIIEQYVDDKNYGRTCLYLVSCCSYLPEPEDMMVLKISHSVYSKHHRWHDALRVALRINDPELIASTFAACAGAFTNRMQTHGSIIRAAAYAIQVLMDV
jgi:26S proteasome regulatory subunit N1